LSFNLPDRPGGTLPDDLAAALGPAHERLGPFASRLRHVASVGSTNDIAAALAASGAAEGTAVVADQQTAGRGRRGHTWFSPPGSGLYVSVVLRPGGADDAARAITLLTLTAGVAVAEGVRAASGLPAAIKWPNDLLVERRKLAGILAEAVASPHGVQAVVLGYGINVRTSAYPPELASRATSIEAELGRPVDRGLVLAETLAALAARYADLAAGRFDAILGAWRAMAPSSRGATVEWATPDGPRRGRTDGIDDDGALLVRTDAGLERIIAGELTWL